MFLGEVIKQYRSNHEMSMQAFADKCNLSKGYIAMLERNVNSKTGESVIPSADTFVKVAEAMNISLSSLVQMVDENQPIALSHMGSQKPANHTEQENELLDLFRKLNDPGKEQALLQVQVLTQVPAYTEKESLVQTGIA